MMNRLLINSRNIFNITNISRVHDVFDYSHIDMHILLLLSDHCDRMVVGFTTSNYLCNHCLSPLKL